MQFETRQHLKTGQKLQLAPRIIQTMEIMQLSLPALEERLEQELESNIALELVEPEPEGEEESEKTPEEVDDEFGRLEEYESQSGSDVSDPPPRTATPIDGRDPKLDAMANIRARQESLSEQLLHQWSFAEVDERTMELGILLIGCIDTDGFLTMTDKEMMKFVESEGNVSVDAKEMDTAISAMQHWLDPPGIAARTLQESLLIQVSELLPADPEGWGHVQTLIKNHLDGLVENKLPKVASVSGLSLEIVKSSLEKMHALTLSPARLLSTDRVLPVIPDAMIEYDHQQDVYIVGICNGNIPALRISAAYDGISKDKNTDENTKQFIHRNINAARWIIEAVGQRKTTLRNIVQIVVDRQRDFLDQGDEYLRPLPMVEVADMLGIHVATVSRAVADKWVQTPRGIFSLRRFFSGGTGSNTDGEMSWEAVKTRMQKIVDQENKQKPLSDEALAKELQEQGIVIARRTVVKYRQQLGIPAARLRKEY